HYDLVAGCQADVRTPARVRPPEGVWGGGEVLGGCVADGESVAPSINGQAGQLVVAAPSHVRRVQQLPQVRSELGHETVARVPLRRPVRAERAVTATEPRLHDPRRRREIERVRHAADVDMAPRVKA